VVEQTSNREQEMKKINLCITTLALGASVASAAEKPNIVIILADDLGWGDVGFHGCDFRTPNLDKLANSGIEMTRFYTAPVSSPTRAGLMTGRYPSRFGIRKTVIPPWRDYGLDVQEQTLADLLGKNGYPNRAIIGKWHLGHGHQSQYPLNRGFTYFYGCLNGAIDYFTHERDGELDWHKNWESCYDKGYSTDLIAGEAANCIDKYSGKDPFFLYVAFNAPHSPYMARQDDLDKLISPEKFNTLKKKEQNHYIYQAMIERLIWA
jgi:arylsulfatase B